VIVRRMKQLTHAAILATAVASRWLVDGPNAAESAKPYRIKNGVVDADAFTGYLRYQGTSLATGVTVRTALAAPSPRRLWTR
jgi:hypothetical protein